MFRSKSGIIASAVVGVGLWLLTGFLAQNGNLNRDGLTAIVPGGTIGYEVVQTEQTYEGVGVDVEITNNSDKAITEGRGILSGKNPMGVRLMQDVTSLCQTGQPLYSGETKTLHFLLWDMELSKIASYSFIASQVKFVDETTEIASR